MQNWPLILAMVGVFGLGVGIMLTPADSAIPPTRAFTKVIIDNSTLEAMTYNDFIQMGGYRDMAVMGTTNPHYMTIMRNSLSGGEASYFSTTGTTISISAGSNGSTNMVKADVPTTFKGYSYFDNGGADNGRIRYTGSYSNTFHIACTISMASTAPNDTFVYAIAKNGVILPESRVIQKITNTGDTRSTAMHVSSTLNQNDYLELYVGNLDDGDDAVVKTINIFALGM